MSGASSATAASASDHGAAPASKELDGVARTTAAPAFYDPSQESVWTRLGLSMESYKRAPGSTGSVLVHCRLSRAFLRDIDSLFVSRVPAVDRRLWAVALCWILHKNVSMLLDLVGSR